MTALQKYTPEHFKTPLVPLSCTFCIFAGIFLIGSAGYEACYRFGIVIGVCLVRDLPLHACQAGISQRMTWHVMSQPRTWHVYAAVSTAIHYAASEQSGSPTKLCCCNILGHICLDASCAASRCMRGFNMFTCTMVHRQGPSQQPEQLH